MGKTEVYVATHNKYIKPQGCRVPIQVGAAKTTDYIQDVRDDLGDNISNKNASYCELTALYWIWKHSRADIVGLEHYRRCFVLTEDEINEILSHDDIIVAEPYFYRMSLEKEYCQSHLADDWENMKRAIERRYPDYQGKMQEIFDQNALIPYNMYIAGKSICDEYCKWLFPILEEVESMGSSKARDAYQGRYLGFLGERLFTLYIRSNSLRVYYGKVKESERQSVLYQGKKWIGQHVWNPLLFKIGRK
ncbi:MAG: DUF4422 domain-containing protein [Lachnospiraceae bacterium]|nr:DUF4422 domain-containing protein [Lachnospiraceae bacterium]